MVRNGQDRQVSDVPHFSIYPVFFILESLTVALYKSQSQEKWPFTHTDTTNTDLPYTREGGTKSHR